MISPVRPGFWYTALRVLGGGFAVLAAAGAIHGAMQKPSLETYQITPVNCPTPNNTCELKIAVTNNQLPLRPGDVRPEVGSGIRMINFMPVSRDEARFSVDLSQARSGKWGFEVRDTFIPEALKVE